MKFLSVCSARPNFVKLAAVVTALKNEPSIDHCIVHTGQHYDPLFSDIFFEQLDIDLPTINLAIHSGNRDEVIGATYSAMMPVLKDIQPDAVLVYGDVNGAVGAARAAAEQGITLVHIEAGLRSFDSRMPEEINRIEIDTLAQYLFCTEESGIDNIAKEKLKGQPFLVGNTMIDTLIRMLPKINTLPVPVVNKEYIVATMHRPSNVDSKESLQKNIIFLEKISALAPVVLPMHHRLKAALHKHNIIMPSSIVIIDPLGYLPFLKLLQGCKFIVTDSGGIQEEAVLLRKRCFTIRKNTERPSTIESGSNILIDPVKDLDIIQRYCRDGEAVQIDTPLYWDGKAAVRILQILVKELSTL